MRSLMKLSGFVAFLLRALKAVLCYEVIPAPERNDGGVR